MSGTAIPVALPWITFAVCWAALGLAAVAGHRWARPPIARLAPGQRSTVLLAVAVAPVVVAALAAVLGFAPAVGGLVVDRHCHDGAGCGPHVPILQTSIVGAGVVTLAIAAVTAVVAWTIYARLARSVVLARILDAFAEARGAAAGDAASAPRRAAAPKIIESREPLACCTGLMRPRVLLSTGLVDALSPEQLRCVVAHESAHAARRDNLRRMLAAVSLWPIPKRWRAPLLRDLALATETACDREAAIAVGDPRLVVETLETLAAAPAAARARAAAFTRGSSTGDFAARLRIAALTAPPGRELPPPVLLTLLAGGYAALAVVSTYLAHHGAERLLTSLS